MRQIALAMKVYLINPLQSSATFAFFTGPDICKAPTSARGMEQRIFEKYDRAHVTESMLQEAAQLFSEHYGIWSEHAAQKMHHSLKAGKKLVLILLPFFLALTLDLFVGSHVRLGKAKLRDDYLAEGTTSSYVRVTVDGRLAGNAFACRWKYNDKIVCWVTQLVVHMRTMIYTGWRARILLLVSLLLEPLKVCTYVPSISIYNSE